MKKSLVKGVALVAASVLGVTGLSLTPANAVTRTVAVVQETNTLSGLNTAVPGKNLVTNTDVLYPTGSGFYYYNDKAQLVRNTAFGTYKIVKNETNDFRVAYIIKKGLKWSDGTLITGQDLLLSHAISSSKYSIKAGLGDPKSRAGSLFDSAGFGGPYDDHTAAEAYTLSDDNYTVTVKYDSFQPDWQIMGPSPSAAHVLVGLAKGKKATQDARTNASYKQVLENAYFDALDTSSNFTGLAGDSVSGAAVINYSVAEAAKLDLGDHIYGAGLGKNGVVVKDINPEFSATTDLTQGSTSFVVDDASDFFAGQEVVASYGDDDGDYEYSATVASVNYATNRVTVKDVVTEEWISASATAPYAGTPGHVYAKVDLSVSSPASLGLVAISDSVAGTLGATQTSQGAAWFSANSLMGIIAKKWSTVWNITKVNSTTNPLLLVSNGGFMIDQIDATSATLKKNPLAAVSGAPKMTGNLETLVFKFPASGSTFSDLAAAQALANKEIDAYSGAPTAAVWSTLKANTAATTIQASSASYEHLDIRTGTSNSGANPACAATYTGPFAGNSQRAKDLRKAFLLTVPRQLIANTYVGKVFDPNTTANSPMLNSSLLLTTEGNYSKVVSGVGAAITDFTKSQAERNAAALVLVKKYYSNAGPDSNSIPVKYLRNTSARRADINLQIKLEAAKVGFNVTNTGNSAWPNFLDCNDYDVFDFAWSRSAISQTGSNANYITEGGNNSYGWSDTAVDAAFNTFERSLTATELLAAQVVAEKALYSNYWTLPLYQWPGVASWNKDLKNVSFNALNPNLVWNYWQWGY
jgi:hypothetical protein